MRCKSCPDPLLTGIKPALFTLPSVDLASALRAPGSTTGRGKNKFLIYNGFKDYAMSRVCEVTGKKPAVGNRVSHANNRKRRRFLPNLHVQRFWLEEEKRWVKLRVSAAAMRTIEKNGIDVVIAKMRAQGDKV